MDHWWWSFDGITFLKVFYRSHDSVLSCACVVKQLTRVCNDPPGRRSCVMRFTEQLLSCSSDSTVRLRLSCCLPVQITSRWSQNGNKIIGLWITTATVSLSCSFLLASASLPCCTLRFPSVDLKLSLKFASFLYSCHLHILPYFLSACCGVRVPIGCYVQTDLSRWFSENNKKKSYLFFLAKMRKRSFCVQPKCC